MEERFETFTLLINRISRNIRKIKIQEMKEYNLRGAHISCLYYLYLSPGLTATELCERCEEDKATISRALDYLEREDYIICKSKSPKRYRSPIELTDKGSVVGCRITKKIKNVLEETAVGLSEKQRADFYHGLSVISKNLEAVCNNSRKKD